MTTHIFHPIILFNMEHIMDERFLQLKKELEENYPGYKVVVDKDFASLKKELESYPGCKVVRVEQTKEEYPLWQVVSHERDIQRPQIQKKTQLEDIQPAPDIEELKERYFATRHLPPAGSKLAHSNTLAESKPKTEIKQMSNGKAVIMHGDKVVGYQG